MTIDWSQTPTHRLILLVPLSQIAGADEFIKNIDYEAPVKAMSDAPGLGADATTITHRVISTLIPALASSLFTAIASARNQVPAATLVTMIKAASPNFKQIFEEIEQVRGMTGTELMEGVLQCKFYIVTNDPNPVLVETNSDTAVASINSRWSFNDVLADLSLVRYDAEAAGQ